MTLSSMTGFARAHGQTETASWSWEFKSVNAKGFDLRLRIPQGLDGVESEVRRMISAVIVRGTVHVALDVTRKAQTPEIRINAALIARLATELNAAALSAGLQPPSMDAVIAVKGAVDIADAQEDDATRENLNVALIQSLEQAVVDLCAARQAEGAVLMAVLMSRIDAMAELSAAAEILPSRQPEAIRARLKTLLDDLLGASNALDPQRLHQEAAVIAIKADIREELDRLNAHVGQTRALLARGGAVGRRLDFIAQELSRETNTICAKSNDIALTSIGMELKTLVEQFREQVQNVE
jgi:uncharacterized protein (TIGR00255 family)